MAVLGVDGWRGGWVGALLDARTVTLLALPDVPAVLDAAGVEVVGIDMPIGLSDDGPRACDVAARALLGRAGASVFPAPLRPVLHAPDYPTACTLSRAASGKALSLQSWHLVPAIRALDEALRTAPGARVHEVHPELAFRALDPRVTDRKASARGLAQRVRALQSAMDVLDGLAAAPAGFPVVDALDACAAAWSAQRIADGTAESVGGDVRDRLGRPMRISW